MPRAALLLALLECSCMSRPAPAGVPDPGRSSLWLVPGIAYADGAERIVIHVEVRDGAGAPVPGAKVQLDAPCPGIRLREPGPAGPDGVSLAEARATLPGRCRVTAKVTARDRAVLLDRGDELIFAPGTRGQRLDLFPFGRPP
jgi:hypothetical protein